ncbi:MAG: tetratricopeptide repeat protein [Synechococcaceae cyanobacterium SM2_3_2]|nr:tetratricopeptide repeat protein [Synechococcaceae cyanobacterium SM2_3_2]
MMSNPKALRWQAGIACGLVTIMGWPAGAEDPFRTGEQARPISAETALAFESFFCLGEYVNSREKLEAAQATSPEEPLVTALLAALSYQESDLEAFANYSTQTRELGEALQETDPLRGSLYEGVGYGMEAANVIVREGVVLGLPRALPILNNLFESIRAAQAVDPEDPELNLLNGYMDLLLTNRDKALEQFQLAGPPYMALRGTALTLRDMGQFEEALEAVDQALETSCDNPELYYLKAQILVGQEEDEAAVGFFDQALESADQLPPGLVEQIERERNSSSLRSEASGF